MIKLSSKVDDIRSNNLREDELGDSDIESDLSDSIFISKSNVNKRCFSFVFIVLVIDDIDLFDINYLY